MQRATSSMHSTHIYCQVDLANSTPPAAFFPRPLALGRIFYAAASPATTLGP